MSLQPVKMIGPAEYKVGLNHPYDLPGFRWLTGGYERAFLPDHMPQHAGDPGKLQAYAFGYGYINALLNAANSEVS